MDTKSKYSKLHVDSAVCFVNCLNHTKAEWYRESFKLIGQQEQIMRDIFGILKPNGYKQFNTAYIEINKKQGKSELTATKEKSTEKIDCAIATIMALDRAIRHQNSDTESIYNEIGFLII